MMNNNCLSTRSNCTQSDEFNCSGLMFILTFSMALVNPWHACAKRVTVIVLVCVCRLSTILALQATTWLMSNISSFNDLRAPK